MSDELRDKIAEVIRAEAEVNWNLDIDMMTGKEMHELADAILAIPELNCRGCRGWKNEDGSPVLERAVYCSVCANELFSDDR